jgi:hypothetical protein
VTAVEVDRKVAVRCADEMRAWLHLLRATWVELRAKNRQRRLTKPELTWLLTLTNPSTIGRNINMSQTTAVRKSSIPARMIIAGVLTAIAGWMTRNYAASRMQEALRIAAIRDPKGGPSVESAISLGYIGLGLIIFGAALFLAGLVVMARRG